MLTTEERFWLRVNRRGPDECWNWTGRVTRWGYGEMRVTVERGRKARKRAHRFAWELVNGAIPQGTGFHGTCVMHTCDNRVCCNPAHMRLGTQGDNMRDRTAKGRTARGERSGSAKLSTAEVISIRERAAAGVDKRLLAAQHGVCHQSIAAIVQRRTWRHVA